MLVYDCFTFFNELDLLEIRLHELSSAVDVFVIAEAPVTFQGDSKPLFFEQNKARFRAYHDRIRHIIVEDMPQGGDPWERERHQRNSLKQALNDAPSDTIAIVSDVDEIPRVTAVGEAATRSDFCFFRMDVFQYFMDWKAARPESGPWVKTYAAPAAMIAATDDLSAPRALGFPEKLRASGLHLVDDAGWHFSWMGGVENMMTKLASFSHNEPAVRKWRDSSLLAAEITNRRFFSDGTTLVTVPIDESFPKLLQSKIRHFERIGMVSPGAARRAKVSRMRTAIGAPPPGAADRESAGSSSAAETQFAALLSELGNRDSAMAQIAGLRSEVAERDAKLARFEEVEAELSAIRAELAAHEAAVAEAAHLRTALSERDAALQRAEAETVDLRGALGARDAAMAMLQNELAALRMAVAQAESQVNKQEAAIDGLRRNVASLEREAKAAQSEAVALRERLAASRKVGRSLVAAQRTGPVLAPATDQLVRQPQGISRLIRHWAGRARH